jgi:hypothetical protein
MLPASMSRVDISKSSLKRVLSLSVLGVGSRAAIETKLLVTRTIEDTRSRKMAITI